MTLNFYTDMTKENDINTAQLLAEIHEKGALVDANAQVLPTKPIEPVNIESVGSWHDSLFSMDSLFPKAEPLKDSYKKAEPLKDSYKKIDKTVNDTSINWLLALIAVLLLLILIFK